MTKSNSQGRVVVVIPVYKPFSREEKCSFRQCIRVLKQYDIVLVKPETLKLKEVEEEEPQIKQIPMSPKWFKSIYSYNHLVLSTFFYEQFSHYEYMLIHQLDAYVFQDRLGEWLEKGYDYVGAPWLPGSGTYDSFLGRCLLRTRIWLDRHFRKEVSSARLYYQVGNGGLSLRKIEKMKELTTHYRAEIDEFLQHPRKKFQEDVFLCMHLPPEIRLSVPDYKEAVDFAFELNPRLAYRHNGNRLPFGCHDWYRKKNWEQFWKDRIRLPCSPASE